MAYYVYNMTELNAYKYNVTLTNLAVAFSVWENATGGKVRFYRTERRPSEGITICLFLICRQTTSGKLVQYTSTSGVPA
jgi:hypothetical protein